ncbi:MAG: SAM-dependent methyltransferase [Pseudomonadales bacterium]|nr:SAM-dependent methyltransferase [Pseudomonadales bacterium]
MADFKDYFSTASDDYKQYRPQYPLELYQYLADIAPATELAFDVGCGNGQASRALARHFQQVFASDASAAQIQQAEPHERVHYQVAPAEQINAPDASVDLITVAQAIHWFQHDAFFAEVDRVLKPNGILAAWGYQLLYTESGLDSLVETFHTEIIGPYWPPERALLDNGYTRIQFPYARLETPPFYMNAHWKFSHLIGYLNTWSAVKQYEQALGKNPVEEYFDDFTSAWGNPDQEKKIVWPLILYAGKKSI